MKTVLKSLLTITAMAVLMVNMTGAYFTSTVTAADNQINTGTLMFGLASSATHTYAGPFSPLSPDILDPLNAYWIAYDDEGNPGVSVNPLETWANAAPGTYSAYVAESGADSWPEGNYSWWVAAVNRGSLATRFQANVTNGEWVDMPRIGTASCTLGDTNLDSVVDEADADPTLVRVMNIHRYDVTPTTGCNNHEECRNVRDGLIAAGYAPQSGVGTHDFAGPVAGTYYGSSDGTSATGTPIDLLPGQFVIYRVDAQLSETADNCYQDAEYEYDLVGNAFQTTDPAWAL